MSASSPRSEKPIKTTGMWLFGGLTVLLTLGKVLGLWPWSWWHVVLPIMIFLGFNGLYIAVGLLYLSAVSVPERPEAEETALVRGHTDLAHYWAGVSLRGGIWAQHRAPVGTCRSVDRMVVVFGAGRSLAGLWCVCGDQSLAVLVADWLSPASARGPPTGLILSLSVSR